jgi:hypothetical protein
VHEVDIGFAEAGAAERSLMHPNIVDHAVIPGFCAGHRCVQAVCGGRVEDKRVEPARVQVALERAREREQGCRIATEHATITAAHTERCIPGQRISSFGDVVLLEVQHERAIGIGQLELCVIAAQKILECVRGFPIWTCHCTWRGCNFARTFRSAVLPADRVFAVRVVDERGIEREPNVDQIIVFV